MAKIINLKSKFIRGDKRLITESSLNTDRSNLSYCVFISHKSDDKDEAKEIANYLKSIGLDVYLDEYDYFLQVATQSNNSENVVKTIKNALATSSHLLCLVSNKTKESWWVPYEIGIADEKRKEIASLILSKLTSKPPEFLEIKTQLRNKKEFLTYFEKYKSQILFSETHSILDAKNRLTSILD